jgi:hypothetical protein
VQELYPNRTLRIWAMDEHRIGLRLPARKLWLRRDRNYRRQRRVKSHGYKYRYIWGAAEPSSGENYLLCTSSADKESFEACMMQMAQDLDISPENPMALLVDNVSYHQQALCPQGLHLVFLPPYSPELMPIERMWPIFDEPLQLQTPKNLKELDLLIDRRAKEMLLLKDKLRALMHFHWWPSNHDL